MADVLGPGALAAVVTMFLGDYLGELVRRGSVDEKWVDRCLDLMWAAVAPEEG